MTTTGIRKALWMTIAVFATPTIVYTVVAIGSLPSFTDALSALGKQLTASRQNLLVTGVLGCVPLLLLWLVLWLHRRFGGSDRLQPLLARSGFLGIALVLLWSNWSYWRVFLPERVYPGFPHGLELVIGPLIFAPVAMLGLMLAAWLVGRRSA